RAGRPPGARPVRTFPGRREAAGRSPQAARGGRAGLGKERGPPLQPWPGFRGRGQLRKVAALRSPGLRGRHRTTGPAGAAASRRQVARRAQGMRLADLRSDLRSMGLGGWLSYAADRALGKLARGRAGFCLLRFYVQPVPASPLVPVRAGDPVQVGPIDPGTVDEAAFKRPAGAVPARFDAGSTCIAATRQGELLGFMWLQPGTLAERIVRCDMRAEPALRVVWDYDFFIEPRY